MRRHRSIIRRSESGFLENQCYKERDNDHAESIGRTTSEIVSFDDTYREIALNCFRYFDFKSFEEVDRLTLPEYELLMEAQRLKEVDKDYRNHLQAYLNFVVQAKKKAGKNKEKPVYSTFRKFFDYEKEVEKAKTKKKKSNFSSLSKFIKEKKGG